jgi:hypothetical protein
MSVGLFLWYVNEEECRTIDLFQIMITPLKVGICLSGLAFVVTHRIVQPGCYALDVLSLSTC